MAFFLEAIFIPVHLYYLFVFWRNLIIIIDFVYDKNVIVFCIFWENENDALNMYRKWLQQRELL